MLAREIMTPDPTVLLPTDTMTHAAELMRDRDIGAVPVVRDRTSMRLEGILTDRDIIVRCLAAHHRTDCHTSDHMTVDHLATTTPDADVHDVLVRMERQQVRRIPVVEADGRLVGIVAQADVARRLGRQEPKVVEELLERISEPAATRQAANASIPIDGPIPPPASAS